MYVPQTHDENMMGDHMKTQLVNAIHLQEVEMQEKSKQIANHSSGDGESVPFWLYITQSSYLCHPWSSAGSFHKMAAAINFTPVLQPSSRTLWKTQLKP